MLMTPQGKQQVDKDPAYRLEANKLYHVVAVEDGSRISLSADGNLLLSYDDPDPLERDLLAAGLAQVAWEQGNW